MLLRGLRTCVALHAALRCWLRGLLLAVLFVCPSGMFSFCFGLVCLWRILFSVCCVISLAAVAPCDRQIARFAVVEVLLLLSLVCFVFSWRWFGRGRRPPVSAGRCGVFL